MKIAFLGNYTLEYLGKKLAELLGKANVSVELFFSGYNRYTQDILDAGSNFYSFKPDLVFLMLQAELLFKDIFTSDFIDGLYTQKMEFIENTLIHMDDLLAALQSRTASFIVMNNFIVPSYSPLGILDTKTELGLKEFISTINIRLNKLSKKYPGLLIFDYNGLVSYYGYKQCFDNKMYYISKTYEKRQFMDVLCSRYTDIARSILGKNKKCLVTDLDNTIWGGLAGEDGLDGIKLDPDGPGKCYMDVQKVLLDLWKKGILLAINSKNNPADALDIIDKHPYMLLRREHFAAMKINWGDKATSLKEIASELNIGLDSMVFLDDNPFERELVRSRLPGVEVLDLPDDKAKYPQVLMECGSFDNVIVTSEDKQRNKMYSDNMVRKQEMAKYGTLDEYLESLSMELRIEPLDSFNLQRVVQLVGKTNQFNMTTKRYGMQDILDKKQNPSYDFLVVSMSDRFGDNGIIGFAILEFDDEVCLIDTFLLSCRVLGRNVETEVMNVVIDRCKQRDTGVLNAIYLQTQKNTAIRYFYRDYGMPIIYEDETEVRYSLDMKNFKQKAHLSGIFKISTGRPEQHG